MFLSRADNAPCGIWSCRGHRPPSASSRWFSCLHPPSHEGNVEAFTGVFHFGLATGLVLLSLCKFVHRTVRIGPRILERGEHTRQAIKGLHGLLIEVVYFRVGLGVLFVCRTQASQAAAQDILWCPQVLLRNAETYLFLCLYPFPLPFPFLLLCQCHILLFLSTFRSCPIGHWSWLGGYPVDSIPCNFPPTYPLRKQVVSNLSDTMTSSIATPCHGSDATSQLDEMRHPLRAVTPPVQSQHIKQESRRITTP